METNKPNLEKRKSRPQSFAAALAGMLRAVGGRASDADLATKWNEIVGAEIARQARLVGLSKGAPGRAKNTGRTLTVRATVPAMATTLAYRTEEIRAAVNKYFGYEAVGSVKVKK